MTTHLLRPDTLTGEALDLYLEQGWYRVGDALMTCRYVRSHGTLRTALWVRLPLRQLTFRKGLRKLMRKVERRFDVRVQPHLSTDEHERVYSCYRDHKGENRSPTLARFLGDAGDTLFDTYEVAMWDGDRLAAFSLFDLGAESVQSLICAYDPSFSKYSLGFVSMLFEIREGLDRDLNYFYPGYVLPGEPSMDYKLRVGELEMLSHAGRMWVAMPPMTEVPLDTDRLADQMQALENYLDEAAIPFELFTNELFEGPAYYPALKQCLDHPEVFVLTSEVTGNQVLLLAWCVLSGCYELLRCGRGTVQVIPPGEQPARQEPVFVVLERVRTSHHPRLAVQHAAKILLRMGA